ncbi:lysine-sensitive aspartokinase 3 [Mesoterricola silvestris]|uniref:Aspartokinase n=1 Tax=Mesoterricola silvestris TaxID=2927979 RepID=A0AA48GFG2_9BACT|nr:lysine-sensitive aspartokinase 3 [Mesoterricola silvestris]BDU71651.1 aspartokinase [Mesoterricola silvestris]
MIVMKFGGSSVADAPCMREVAALAAAAHARSPLVVLSATARTTDQLFEAATAAEGGDLPGALALHAALVRRHRNLAEELLPAGLPADLDGALADLAAELDLLLRGVALLKELSPRSMDAIASIGERLSTRILAAYMGAAWVDARTVLRTDAAFGSARPLVPDLEGLAASILAPLLGPGRAVVTQGYIGATAQGLTTTLGRGGSDFSAALFGAALGAEDIQIWTDVEGVLTSDPRVVPGAQPIPELSFAEAGELAAFGAKVLHPATIQPAVDKGIPVTVRHTRKPGGRFTTITAEVRTGRPVTALAHRGPVTVLTVASARMLNQSGFLARLFDVFARHRVSVDLIATAEVSVSLTVEADAPLEDLIADLSAFATVGVAGGRAIVAIVGERLKHTPGVTGLAFGAMQDINVEMISMGANEINLSIVVKAEEAKKAVQRLHAALIGGGAA